MKQHEWVVSWSGGKDSTATIILMHEHKIPIKEIVYVRMMYDEELPATLPIMTDFVDDTKKVFESWGYKVSFIYPKRNLVELMSRKYKRSSDPNKNGKSYGVTALMRGFCNMTDLKQKTIQKFVDESEGEYQMIGYASDELERIGRLGGKKQSIMLELGVKESKAFEICKNYNLLSPLYNVGVGRDGCWFCPNAGKKERKMLKEQYPELVSKIYASIEMCEYMNPTYLNNYSKRNNWVAEYILDKEQS